MIRIARASRAIIIGVALFGGALFGGAVFGGESASATPVAPRDLPDRLPSLLSDANNDPCTATIRWTGGKDVQLKAAQDYVIQCRPDARTRGVFRRGVASGEAICGPAGMLAIPGLGATRARRCRDTIGATRYELAAHGWSGSADVDAIGPLVVALRITRARSPDAVGSPVDLALFATLAPPAPATGIAAVRGADRAAVRATIQSGLQASYAGRNVEASRLLRDAIATYAGEEPQNRIELRLNAALAESNVGAFGSADAYFAAADALIAGIPSDPVRNRWTGRAVLYRALHLLNQNRWAEAETALVRSGSADAPLKDRLILAELNRPPGTRMRQGIDQDFDNALILQAQANTALSVARLHLGQRAAAQASLDDASLAARSLQRELADRAPASFGSIGWLLARIERQQGRLSFAAGNIDRAIASFDCAVADLQAVPAAPGGCLFAPAPARGVALSGPAIADAQLERATVLEARPGVDHAAVLAAYQRAVETLESFSDTLSAPSPLLGHYLDLLIADGSPAAIDRFLRALQTVRVPAIARQIGQLQAAVASGPAAGLLRTRQEIQGQQVQYRAQIPLLAVGDPQVADLQDQMRRNDEQLSVLRRQLSSDSRIAALDDSTVVARELQAALRPAEAYWRLAAVGPRVFGAVMLDGQTTIYAVTPTAPAIAALAQKVLASVRVEDGRAPSFATAASASLFSAVVGPAAARLRAARSVIVDSADVLHGVPPAVLVTQVAAGGRYSAVPFLIRQADLATVASPRSFLRSRLDIRASQAPQPFIGFGENGPPPVLAPGTMLKIAFDCTKPYAEWRDNYAGIIPISKDQIGMAALALDDPAAPIVTDAAFTDVGILRAARAGDLARYQVLHFATHGMPSTPVPGCVVPLAPSLLTSIAAPASGDARQSTGLLSFIDIAQLNLDANLVVLSACDTAAQVDQTLGRLGGQEDAGTAFDGLIRAFFSAHARAVIATAWNIPAATGTEALIATLYRTGRTQTIGASLRAAQLAVLDNPGTSHPVFWGAFFLIGDGAKHMLTPVAVPAAAATPIVPGD